LGYRLILPAPRTRRRSTPGALVRPSQLIVVRASLMLLAIGACVPPESVQRAQSAVAPSVEPTTASRAPAFRLAPPEPIRPTAFANPEPEPPPLPGPLFVRGMYGRDSSPTGLERIGRVGFNAVTVQPYRSELDELSKANMKGVVWLWGYDGSTCSFSRSDDEIRSQVSLIAGHPAILAYQIDDEPGHARTGRCPQVASQIRARSRLVESVDPMATTYLVVSTWDGEDEYPYQHFAGTTDVMGIDVYPFSGGGSHLEMIDRAIREAEKDGVRRYWAILQDFSDDYFDQPTASQVAAQFRLWWRSRMEGYFIYHWDHGQIETRPDHLELYRTENSRRPPKPT
jgi:hypothetical protein